MTNAEITYQIYNLMIAGTVSLSLAMIGSWFFIADMIERVKNK